MFRLTIELGNDAMESPEEVAAALREVAAKVAAGETSGAIRDANGNTVGAYSID